MVKVNWGLNEYQFYTFCKDLSKDYPCTAEIVKDEHYQQYKKGYTLLEKIRDFFQ